LKASCSKGGEVRGFPTRLFLFLEVRGYAYETTSTVRTAFNSPLMKPLLYVYCMYFVELAACSEYEFHCI